uniref:Uncharacterized protein n=1 Tax=Oryza brachyantha TaxID=4533 RepID=J3LJ47_ORYBR
MGLSFRPSHSEHEMNSASPRNNQRPPTAHHSPLRIALPPPAASRTFQKFRALPAPAPPPLQLRGGHPASSPADAAGLGHRKPSQPTNSLNSKMFKIRFSRIADILVCILTSQQPFLLEIMSYHRHGDAICIYIYLAEISVDKARNITEHTHCLQLGNSRRLGTFATDS